MSKSYYAGEIDSYCLLKDILEDGPCAFQRIREVIDIDPFYIQDMIRMGVYIPTNIAQVILWQVLEGLLYVTDTDAYFPETL